MRSRTRVVCVSCVALIAVVALPTIASAATTTKTFSTTGPLALPPSGVPGLYPWNIAVSGLSGTTSDVNVTLTGLSHTRVSDLDALLVSPTGGSALFMSDVGDDTDIPVPGINVTFDDGASGNAPVGAPLTAGTYRPTNAGLDPDPFIPPAPAGNPPGVYGSSLATFKSVSPVGDWSLYLNDDDGVGVDPGTGMLQGWSLKITSTTTSTTKKKKKAKTPKPVRRPRCGRKRTRRARIRCKCRHRPRYRAAHPRRCKRVLSRRHR
jgi:subtilisin-like proprotein convertase family protein